VSSVLITNKIVTYFARGKEVEPCNSSILVNLVC
jgi:hypothetical protein